jgi:arsenite methyltransferase
MEASHSKPLETDQCVRERYSAASQQVEPALCCPVTYDAKFLDVIPEEVINRDYGCGDPSPYVRPGDTVVDLGSGGGKLCFIISQQVGPSGKVIGVDVNPDMLELARRSQPDVAEKTGYDNIEFRYGRIQDLAVDLEELAARLKSVDLQGTEGALQCFQIPDELRRTQPMIADNSVDCVVSNCVLNLVDPADRRQLFAEIFRVLKPGGRAAISDIVSDEDVPLEMQNDPTLWSGCISGAWREDLFLEEFQNAGFVGLKLDKRQSEAWQTVNGIEFRSVTLLAIKPSSAACLERKQAVVYKGPFEEVVDDDGGVYPRGIRMAVCDKTFQLLSQPPYCDLFYFIEPNQPVTEENASEFDCQVNRVRSPRETKGQLYNLTIQSSDDCCGGTDGC